MIGVGEGGVICKNNKNLYNLAEKLGSRNSPFRSKKDPYWKKYHCLGEGYNYKLPHLLGAVGRAQIENLKKKFFLKRLKLKKFMKNFLIIGTLKSHKKYSKLQKPVYWLNNIF